MVDFRKFTAPVDLMKGFCGQGPSLCRRNQPLISGER
jgi:hypothetical protein